jgi:hypothetical protein
MSSSFKLRYSDFLCLMQMCCSEKSYLRNVSLKFLLLRRTTRQQSNAKPNSGGSKTTSDSEAPGAASSSKTKKRKRQASSSSDSDAKGKKPASSVKVIAGEVLRQWQTKSRGKGHFQSVEYYVY